MTDKEIHTMYEKSIENNIAAVEHHRTTIEPLKKEVEGRTRRIKQLMEMIEYDYRMLIDNGGERDLDLLYQYKENGE